MLTLCMMLSLSISAFAASDTIASGTIPDSKIKWELDSHGWLTISGSGEAPVFQSADVGGISGTNHGSLVRRYEHLDNLRSGILV
mgnify:CR=1 FL=1